MNRVDHHGGGMMRRSLHEVDRICIVSDGGQGGKRNEFEIHPQIVSGSETAQFEPMVGEPFFVGILGAGEQVSCAQTGGHLYVRREVPDLSVRFDR